MDETFGAVVIVLLALAAIVAIAVLSRKWIERAPTDKAAKKRRDFVWVYIVIAFLIVGSRDMIAETKLWRRISGTCLIVLLNKSGAEVTNLDWTLRATGDPEAETKHAESFSKDGRWSFKTHADEFKVERLTGVAGTNHFSFRGAAKKGERLVIAIEADGRIAARVE